MNAFQKITNVNGHQVFYIELDKADDIAFLKKIDKHIIYDSHFVIYKNLQTNKFAFYKAMGFDIMEIGEFNTYEDIFAKAHELVTKYYNSFTGSNNTNMSTPLSPDIVTENIKKQLFDAISLINDAIRKSAKFPVECHFNIDLTEEQKNKIVESYKAAGWKKIHLQNIYDFDAEQDNLHIMLSNSED